MRRRVAPRTFHQQVIDGGIDRSHIESDQGTRTYRLDFWELTFVRDLRRYPKRKHLRSRHAEFLLQAWEEENFALRPEMRSAGLLQLHWKL